MLTECKKIKVLLVIYQNYVYNVHVVQFNLMGVDILPQKSKAKVKAGAKAKTKIKKQMTTDMKVFIAVCTVVVLILAAAVVYMVMPKDIAVVKDNKVTNAEFKYYYSVAYQQWYSYYYFIGMADQVDENTLTSLAKQSALNRAVEVEYLLQEAEKNGFTVSEGDLAAEWNNFETSLKNSADAFKVSIDTYVKQSYGIKYDQIKSIYKDAVKAQKYKDKLMDEMQFSEDELKTYYEENKDNFDYNTVRHILIECDENAEDSVVEEKKKLAESLLERVNNGEDFAELAKEYSDDTGTKNNGGLLEVKKGETVKEFEDWTFSHNIGDTGVIRTKYGFHVMKLEGITNTFDALKDTVIETCKENKYETALQDALKNEYKVVVKNAFYDFSGI